MTDIVYYYFNGQYWTEDFTEMEFVSSFGDGEYFDGVNESWMMI